MSGTNMPERWLILWLGMDEWEVHHGTLDSAKRRVMDDGNYRNYGRKGAVILPLVEPVYEIPWSITDTDASWFAEA